MAAETKLRSMSDCIFCKIVAGEIATEFVYEGENILAFRDIAPLARLHLLVIPKKHLRNVVELTDSEPELLSELMRVASDLANQHTAGSFKLQFNTGSEAGQTVFHAHAHVLSDQVNT